MLSILKGPKFEQILQKARDNWIEFTPTKEEVVTAGIDSSFNNTNFKELSFGQQQQFQSNLMEKF